MRIPGLREIGYTALVAWICGCAVLGCQSSSQEVAATRVNTAHLDHLYEEIVSVTGDSVGIIHIYSEYPDYSWVGDGDEGVACVDDAARAAIFYLRNNAYTGNSENLRKGRMLLKFLLGMQAENGYFYNFVWPDHTINTDGRTSSAVPDWWSWRVLWAYGEALAVLDQHDALTGEIVASRDRLVRNILVDLALPAISDTLDGIVVPTWLPYGSAADQAALIMLGLTLIQPQELDTAILSCIHHMGNGLRQMQVENDNAFPHGAFLSYQNIWHAYGNSQSYVLLEVGRMLGDTVFVNSALTEVQQFYPELWERGGRNYFTCKRNTEGIELVEQESFAQIAYGLRPVIWACLAAWESTGQEAYLNQARKYGNWFDGDNPANVQMYDPATGRGYDGIASAQEFNRNSGAESTIEALLAIQELERYSDKELQ